MFSQGFPILCQLYFVIPLFVSYKSTTMILIWYVFLLVKTRCFGPSHPSSGLSESVPLAPITCSNLALPAFENVLWEVVITLLTLIGSANPAPAIMCAIMTIAQVFNGVLDLYRLFRRRHRSLGLFAGHYLFCASF